MLSLLEAQNLLQKNGRVSIFVSAMRDAVHVMNQMPPKAQQSFDDKAIWVIFNRMTYTGINQALASDIGIRRIANQGGESVISVEDEFVIRVKHLSDKLLSANFRTPRSIMWNAQLPLFEILPDVRLELGYRLDAINASLQDAFILMRVGKEISWVWQIAGILTSTFAKPSSLFSANIVFAYTPC